jgi:hypothetical protein
MIEGSIVRVSHYSAPCFFFLMLFYDTIYIPWLGSRQQPPANARSSKNQNLSPSPEKRGQISRFWSVATGTNFQKYPS